MYHSCSGCGGQCRVVDDDNSLVETTAAPARPTDRKQVLSNAEQDVPNQSQTPKEKEEDTYSESLGEWASSAVRNLIPKRFSTAFG